ncbi:hypothetical protein GGR54DRAFT_647957 [Hypoxylon sp. NC1633]|nr:hypothetical protein GGR54DRAFT_647957 [Hypoxylon sp. NC1633]
MAHDEGGHFAPNITVNRLNQTVYWPCMAQDTVDYYLGYLQCAEYNPRKSRAPDLPVTICEPFQIIVADFIGPFPVSRSGYRYIYCLADAFSRFGWGFKFRYHWWSWYRRGFAFVDASFANHEDLSSQLGFLVVLANETMCEDSFAITGNLLHWNSVKSKRVTRSVLASEIYAMVNGVDVAMPLRRSK